MIGLKENVIIGKPIPAGTGMKRYRTINLSTDAEFEEDGEILLTEDDEILLSDDSFEDADEILAISEVDIEE